MAKQAFRDGYYVSANRDELPRALHVSAALLAALPRLKVVATYGAGFDTVDIPACAHRGARKVELAELLASSDVVTLHCPLTAETRGLFDAEKFAAMRPGAIFVNTARGSTYDEAALEIALDSGHLGGAGLDVWAHEPPGPDHPLLAHPAVLASPHTAGVTHESRDRVARLAAHVFVEAAAGGVPARCLNPDTAERLRPRPAGSA